MTARAFTLAPTVRETRIPNLLALDASLGAVSVAVVCRGEEEPVAREAFEPRSGEHAEQLMAMIGRVMGEAGVTFVALERIAVTVGPGSFTGVRVGIAAARGLAVATGCPAVGASSLAVMAQEAARLLPAGTQRALAVAVDAGRGMVFFQLFEPGPNAISPPLYLSPAQAPTLIGTRAFLLVGSGADAVGAAVRRAGGTAEAALPTLQPRARSLLPLCSGGGGEPVRPLYLRPHGARPSSEPGVASGR